MASTKSKLGPGTLKIGTTLETGCQAANVRLVPDHEDEDGTPVLCNPNPAPTLTTTWSLQGDFVQDWELPDGVIEYARTNSGTEQPFEWIPNTAAGVTYAGVVQVRAMEIGGDVGKEATSSFEWPVVGVITRTEGTGGLREVV